MFSACTPPFSPIAGNNYLSSLYGAAGRIIQVRRIELWAIAAASSFGYQVNTTLERVAITGGTIVTLTATKWDSKSSAATATAVYYTGIESIVADVGHVQLQPIVGNVSTGNFVPYILKNFPPASLQLRSATEGVTIFSSSSMPSTATLYINWWWEEL